MIRKRKEEAPKLKKKKKILISLEPLVVRLENPLIFMK